MRASSRPSTAADERGWYFPNQRFGIARQLRDGITGFLIDVHYGIRDPRNGRIRTPLTGEGSSRNKVAQELGPEPLKVADRLAGRVGAKLPAPRIPADDHTGEDAQHELGDQGGQKKTDTGLFPVVLEQRPIDDAADDAGEKYHKRI